MLYDLARDYDGTFPNSRVWRGTPASGAVVQQITGTARDFWATLSPDGSKIAVSRFVAAAGAIPAHYDLFSVNVASNIATKLTPATFNKNAFAPSWSPDGQRLAFIMSDGGGDLPINGTNYSLDQGNVYSVDANGHNFRQIGDKSRIYPPTWFDNNVVIYAGFGTVPLGSFITANSLCPDTLCYFDYTTNTLAKVSTNLQFGSDIFDMPVIRLFGATPDHYLFYRHDDAVNRMIRTAKITYNGTSFGIDVFGTGTHNAVAFSGSPTQASDVDYFNVSALLGIVFYTSDPFNIYNSTPNNPATFSWNAITSHHVDGAVGNPSWDGSPDSPTDLHALRQTIEWLP
jgi:dipeptidyl aminopeptidase/acylaminoacyl peptidase